MRWCKPLIGGSIQPRPARPRRRRLRDRAGRRGFVLILVFVVIMMLSLGAYTLSDLMVTEHEATRLHGKQMQAQALADSGVESLQWLLQQDPLTRSELGGIYDNPSLFQAVLVVDDVDPNLRGRFTIVSPDLFGGMYEGGVRFGLERESIRWNLNALVYDPALADALGEDGARNLLLMLPGMTEEIADSILDWIDQDDEPRQFGAESADYASLKPPYAPKDGPLDTVDELLLVRGVTPDLLFGADSNRNGMVDQHEMAQPVNSRTGGSLGELDRGWSAYLTLYSMERNANALGQKRINLNTDDMEQLYDELAAVMDKDWATFILAYRQNGPFNESDSGGGGGGSGGGASQESPIAAGGGGGDRASTGVSDRPAGGRRRRARGGRGGGGGGRGGGGGGGRGGGGGGGGFAISPRGGAGNRANQQSEPIDGRQVDLTKDANTKIENVLDLIDKKVQVTFDGDSRPALVESPFTNDQAEMRRYLPILMDEVTVDSKLTMAGRININQAPPAVLAGIPRMSEEMVTEILNRRDVQTIDDDSDYSHATWLLTEGIVTLDQMKALMPLVTTGGDVYRAQVVGYFEGGRASARTEVIVDAASTSTPRVLFWRDMSHLGRGFALETLGAELVGP